MMSEEESLSSVEHVRRCICVVGGVTVNDSILLGFSCPLLSYFAMSLHTDRVRLYACVWKERERGERRERRTGEGEGEVRGKQKRARERNRVEGTGHYKDAENERKNALQ